MAPFEAPLVEIARHVAPDDLARKVREITDALDGDGGAGTDEELFERRRYHASRSIDDLLNVNALYDPESAQIHEQAIDAELARDFRANDPGTPQQRRA